jgi:hypothetical protein
MMRSKSKIGSSNPKKIFTTLIRIGQTSKNRMIGSH